ncbi:hypothetical protein AAMO2058_000250200 [Amorphochlora amoebiformis]
MAAPHTADEKAARRLAKMRSAQYKRFFGDDFLPSYFWVLHASFALTFTLACTRVFLSTSQDGPQIAKLALNLSAIGAHAIIVLYLRPYVRHMSWKMPVHTCLLSVLALTSVLDYLNYLQDDEQLPTYVPRGLSLFVFTILFLNFLILAGMFYYVVLWKKSRGYYEAHFLALAREHSMTALSHIGSQREKPPRISFVRDRMKSRTATRTDLKVNPKTGHVTVGTESPNITNPSPEKLFNKLDLNKDGVIDQSEFATAFESGQLDSGAVTRIQMVKPDSDNQNAMMLSAPSNRQSRGNLGVGLSTRALVRPEEVSPEGSAHGSPQRSINPRISEMSHGHRRSMSVYNDGKDVGEDNSLPNVDNGQGGTNDLMGTEEQNGSLTGRENLSFVRAGTGDTRPRRASKYND